VDKIFAYLKRHCGFVAPTKAEDVHLCSPLVCQQELVFLQERQPFIQRLFDLGLQGIGMHNQNQMILFFAYDEGMLVLLPGDSAIVCRKNIPWIGDVQRTILRLHRTKIVERHVIVTNRLYDHWLPMLPRPLCIIISEYIVGIIHVS
jgi:hypothetical protein